MNDKLRSPFTAADFWKKSAVELAKLIIRDDDAGYDFNIGSDTVDLAEIIIKASGVNNED
jgi:hypothetical protein